MRRIRGWLRARVASARPWVLGTAMWAHAHCLYAATLPAGFSESVVASGIPGTTAMEFAPDGRLFVCQQNGHLRVIKNLSLLATPFISLTVDGSNERGLLGIAFDPGFATNNYLYLYYTATSPTTHNRLSRFTANGDIAVSGSELPIMDLPALSAGNHNGGAIHFGRDGKLYIVVGENAVPSNAQSLSTRLGKMLRINRDGSIPADNPFYTITSGANRSIWALGLRNPYTFAVQPGTGRIFINDVGQDTWEEINDGIAGANYGWPDCEGRCTPSVSYFRDPVFQYGHGANPTNGCAITGGAFYNPVASQYPAAYRDTYFFADVCGGWIRRLNPNTYSVSNFATSVAGPVDLKVSAEGRLFYLARTSGQVWAINYTNSSPSLGILRQGASAVLLWPAPSTGYVLQSAPSLPATGWTTVPDPVLVTNGQNRVTVAASSASRFFRLMKP